MERGGRRREDSGMHTPRIKQGANTTLPHLDRTTDTQAAQFLTDSVGAGSAFKVLEQERPKSALL